MIIVMQMGAPDEQVEAVISRIEAAGFAAHRSSGAERTIIGIVGNDRPLDGEAFCALNGVDSVMPILAPYKLASRDFHPADSVVQAGRVSFGGCEPIVMMAGPCSIESRDQALRIAEQLAEQEVGVFRGGAFKPRTSPYSFMGLGEEALKIMAEIREQYGMATITEVMSPDEVDLVAGYVDILQLGTRNMQNYRLLEAVGRQSLPVLLKRGMSSTIEELLLAAEYILAGGNPHVLLCERGIRTFEPATRSTFDLNAIPVLRSLSHLPIVVDPSHATGRADLVEPVSRAAIAAGVDALLVEVHDQPDVALSDGGQSLRPEEFARLRRSCGRVAAAVDRSLAVPAMQTRRG
jgi:3-deoxy-7-phosphoheptulonate synthase